MEYSEITDEKITVNTLAGEFQCFAFDMVEQIPGPYEKKILQKYYYSKEIGHVKTEYFEEPGYMLELVEYNIVPETVNFED